MNETSIDDLSILLVDDEPKVINGLERNISMMEDGWDITVAYSGAEALEQLSEQPVDIIVSDLRMPEMNGAQFLAKAKIVQPDSVRFILSGYADQDLMIKATGVAHRYLTKPCDSQEVVDAIRQVYETRSLMANTEIYRYVNETGELHADNKPLQELLDLTNDPDCNLDELAALLRAQPTVHAAILHLANSAFFGASRRIASIDEAMQVLGVEFVRSLAILELSKSQLQLTAPLKLLAEEVIRHCVETSQFALQLRPMVESPKLLQTLASLCLLHDLGKLVFIARKKEEYQELWTESFRTKTPLWKLEKDQYGCDHSGIGAYLFDLWGLPEELIRGVAWHHEPLKVTVNGQCPVSLLSVVNSSIHKINPTESYYSGELDPAFSKRFAIPQDLLKNLS